MGVAEIQMDEVLRSSGLRQNLVRRCLRSLPLTLWGAIAMSSLRQHGVVRYLGFTQGSVRTSMAAPHSVAPRQRNVGTCTLTGVDKSVVMRRFEAVDSCDKAMT